VSSAKLRNKFSREHPPTFRITCKTIVSNSHAQSRTHYTLNNETISNMAERTKAPAQHKQPSRKGKKAWRKNVDVSEVQEGLEALREEIILGGPIAEKPSEELFAVDTVGSEDIKKRHKLQKPLTADKILAQRSAVRAVDSRKRPTNSRVTDGILEPSSKRQKQGWISKKEVARIRDTLHSGPQLTTARLEEDESPVFDLWSGIGAAMTVPSKGAMVKQVPLELAEYVEPVRAKVAPGTLKQAPKPMTASGRPVKAVRDPKAGSSYNPTFDDWDAALTKEGEKEIEAERKRRAAAMAEAEKEARVAAASNDDVNYQTDPESAWEGFETDREDSSLKAKRPERKTQAQRNKIKRRKEAERQAKHEQRMANKKKQAREIEEALRAGNIVVAEKMIEEAEQYSSDSDDDELLRRRRLGTAPIPEKSLEVVLPDELQESLRRLKPEGNLLNDRFRNLLVNGKLESRKPILQPKKAKTFVTEKWSYKDFSVSV
jgi:nucleolar protein 53